jgi:succinate dehydrogenase/fumarate reductase iron-sulfur protein
MTISPLKNLPVIKDLVFDRSHFFALLGKFKPYVVRKRAPECLPEVLKQPGEHTQLMGCRECFGCMSLCPKYDDKNDAFGGPLGFVKLAQLHYDVRDSVDRVLQAKEMGILTCVDCRGCACILGMPIHKVVIKHFLEKLNEGTA